MRLSLRTQDRLRRQKRPPPQGLRLVRSSNWRHRSASPRESLSERLPHLEDTKIARQTVLPPRLAYSHSSGSLRSSFSRRAHRYEAKDTYHFQVFRTHRILHVSLCILYPRTSTLYDPDI